MRRQGLETIEVDAGAGYAQLGPRHFRIDPEAAEGYGRMIAALAGDGPPIDWIFHLWTCDERHRELDDAPALEAAQELGALSVLRLVRALSSELGGDLASVFKVRLFVVSSHVQPVADDEILRVENGTLPGLIHTLARELSWLDPRHLDLAPGETASDAAVLVAEARDASADREVAWRSGRRLVPRLREVDFAAADSSGPGFRQGGCYLLTGGLGGLGAETARSLLTRYQARLLLLGKSSLPETGEPLATLQALRELPGEVSYQAVDVGDAERLRAVVEEAERRWDRPLDGVLHLAASHRDRPLLEETDASLASTLHPKLRGSWVLDRVLADRQLDFFVHYSSVLAFLGGAGAGAYAAANSFQDRFVYHQRRRGRRAFCFAWSQWEDLGLSRGLPAPGSTTGVRRIDPERGFHSVQGGLRQTAAYLAIGLDASRPGLRRLGVTEASLTHRLSAFTTAAEAELSDASLSLSDRYGNLHRCELVRLAEMPRTEDGEVDVEALTTARGAAARRNVAPRNALERQLREIWRRLLGVERIGVFDDFFDLGGDSILATQFVSRAKQSGLELAPKELFEHKTIAALAAAYGRGPKAQAEQGPVTGPTPLLPSQHWFFDMHLPRPDHFNHYYYLELRDPLPPGVLREAIAHLLRHHDALRLRFERHPDGWRAHLAAPDAQVAFTLVDLSRVPESERPGVLEALGDRFQASLDLGAGPILRVAHFRFGPGSPERLAIVVHHLAVDLISRSFLLEDLQTAIEQLSSGEAVALPAKTSSVQRWGERLRDHARTPEVEAELDYWLAEARYRVPPVPLDHPGGRYTNISDAVVRGGLDEDATASLLNAQRRLGPAETLLLTAIAQTFRPWTGASALSVDVVNYGRSPIFDDLDVSRTTGWFAAPYPLLVDPGDAADTTEAVRRVQAQIDAVPASGLGHGLLRYLHPDAEVREKLRAVPRSILDFSYLGEMLADPDSLSLLRELRQDIGNPQDPRGEWCYSMSIFAFVLDGRLRLSWRYSENLHRRATIEELMNRLVQRLAEMAFPARKESPGHRAAKRT